MAKKKITTYSTLNYETKTVEIIKIGQIQPNIFEIKNLFFTIYEDLRRYRMLKLTRGNCYVKSIKVEEVCGE